MADKAEKFTLATIDETGLLTGFRTVDDEAEWVTGKKAVAVPNECDLVPGRYRWHGKYFLPLPPAASQDALEVEPNAVRAVARGFMAIEAAGLVALPAETVAWLDAYRKSIDNVAPQ